MFTGSYFSSLVNESRTAATERWAARPAAPTVGRTLFAIHEFLKTKKPLIFLGQALINGNSCGNIHFLPILI